MPVMDKSSVEAEAQKHWWVTEFEVSQAQEDLASWLMMHIGARGCEIIPCDSGVAGTESGGTGKVKIHATFDEEVLPGGDVTRLSAALDEYGLSPSIATVRVKELLEEDWLAKWKVGFEPFPVGEKLLVCPAWLKDTLTKEQVQGRSVIVIEPGLAFGTGFHDTTRFCLAAVERYVGAARKVIDVGTGSGILAIGAALLNPDATIVAVENDTLACKVARENFELNGVAHRIQLVEGITDDLTPAQKCQYDLILSNLTFEDNSALLPDYAKLCGAGTHLAFAGILREKRDRMVSALESNSFELEEEGLTDMWAGLIARPAWL